MIRQNLRRLVLASGVAVTLLGSPSESKAIFHWFSNCCGGGGTRTTYMPPMFAPAPACTSCAMPAPQVCNYTPVTAYRTVYMPVPVTAYQPVSACDPCSGCPVTTLRPITTYVQQVRLVPYTTYRPVYASACASPCGSPCGIGGCASGACGVAAPSYLGAAPACSSCAPAAGPVPTYGPSNGGSLNGASGTTYGPTPAPPAANGSAPSNGAPANAAPQDSTPAKTYSPPPAELQKKLKPIPSDTGTPASPSGMPRLTDPSNRTTYQAPRQTWVYSPSSATPSAYSPTSYSVGQPEAAPADDEGWRPARHN
ncbi:MAG: hypothetical protein ACYC35_25925 [Pirellulales bacterium]